MSQNDFTSIRLKRTTVMRLRGIGTRGYTDDDAVVMLLNAWDTKDKTHLVVL